jgi:hypothetical protein
MSYTLVIQDWLRVAGASTVVALQPESDMLDISMFQDLSFYIEVSEVTNTLLKIQTAPIKEEAYFMAGDLVSVVASTGLPTPTKVRWETATVPPARWLRWRATNNTAAAWNITFRITASLNPGGSIMRPMASPPMNGGMMAPASAARR